MTDTSTSSFLPSASVNDTNMTVIVGRRCGVSTTDVILIDNKGTEWNVVNSFSHRDTGDRRAIITSDGEVKEI